MQKKAWLKTSNSFKAQIIGKLLGDGGITRQNGRKPRFRINHAAIDFEWGHYCYEKLKTHIPFSFPKYRKANGERLEKGYSVIYAIQSKVWDIVTFLHKA